MLVYVPNHSEWNTYICTTKTDHKCLTEENNAVKINQNILSIFIFVSVYAASTKMTLLRQGEGGSVYTLNRINRFGNIPGGGGNN